MHPFSLISNRRMCTKGAASRACSCHHVTIRSDRVAFARHASSSVMISRCVSCWIVTRVGFPAIERHSRTKQIRSPIGLLALYLFLHTTYLGHSCTISFTSLFLRLFSSASFPAPRPGGEEAANLQCAGLWVKPKIHLTIILKGVEPDETQIYLTLGTCGILEHRYTNLSS